MTNSKVLSFDKLVKKVVELRKAGKTVVQSHGIFDLIHPGIINHLNDAKNQGDVLIVTIIKDEDVRKMPGRPIFPGNMRIQNIASLSQVDYVALTDEKLPYECVRKIKPDVFAKGKSYLERDYLVHGEAVQDYFGESRIYETRGHSFSSSQIISSLLDIYPDDTKVYLKEFSNKYNFDKIVHEINSLKNLKVLLIGDGIIDEYHYCETMGKSPKSQLIVNKYIDHETFAGGAFAIANHIAGLCNEVQLLSLLGINDSREDFICNNLKPNVKTKFFYRDDGPTIVKKRYINQYQRQKLFEINYINDSFIDDDCESDVINYIEAEIPKYDIVLVSDFGHGLITNKIIRTIEKIAKKMAVNAQTNGANAGYNLITKYRKSSFICMDVPEARLATQEKYAEIRDVGKKILEATNTELLMITQGSAGSTSFSKIGNITHTPAFATKVVDVVGAGDAFFAFTAPLVARGMSLDLIPFIGNAVGGLAVQIMGNKKPVEKYELLEFIHALLK